jgi:hypothetical protein
MAAMSSGAVLKVGTVPRGDVDERPSARLLEPLRRLFAGIERLEADRAAARNPRCPLVLEGRRARVDVDAVEEAGRRRGGEAVLRPERGGCGCDRCEVVVTPERRPPPMGDCGNAGDCGKHRSAPFALVEDHEVGGEASESREEVAKQRGRGDAGEHRDAAITRGDVLEFRGGPCHHLPLVESGFDECESRGGRRRGRLAPRRQRHLVPGRAQRSRER